MMDWIWKPFEALSLDELYALLCVRQEVFAVEQKILYADPDWKDQRAWHLFGLGEPPQIAAYLRVIPPESSGGDFRIGRVLTAHSHRGKGWGKALILQSLSQIRATWGDVPVSMAAQAYLEDYYKSLGFQTESAPYILEDVAHIEMRYVGEGG